MMTLEGKKTYITAGVVALASFALAMGWLSQEQYQVIIGLLGSLGLAALRSGVARSCPDKVTAGEPAERGAVPGGAKPASGAAPAVTARG
jgi:hypothetical protein